MIYLLKIALKFHTFCLIQMIIDKFKIISKVYTKKLKICYNTLC